MSFDEYKFRIHTPADSNVHNTPLGPLKQAWFKSCRAIGNKKILLEDLSGRKYSLLRPSHKFPRIFLNKKIFLDPFWGRTYFLPHSQITRNKELYLAIIFLFQEKLSRKKQFSRIFLNKNFFLGDCWGRIYFLPHSQITRNKIIFLAINFLF